MEDQCTVGYVVVDFNKTSGRPSFAWNDEIHPTVDAAVADADEARAADGDAYAVAELRLIEKPRAGALEDAA